jgi:ABC-type transport system involved in multi-copper enzyme maturation permease subunit
MALFPVALVAMIRYQGGPLDRQWPSGIVLFNLIPGLTCVLALMLWATPMVHSELEARTWPYLAVRPGGKTAVLLGKYLSAVAWTIAVAWLSLTLSIAVLFPEPEVTFTPTEKSMLSQLLQEQREMRRQSKRLAPDQSGQLERLREKQAQAIEDAQQREILGPKIRPLQTWWVLAVLVALSSLTYGALFTFFGVLLLRRAMALAVAYTFLVEVVVSLVPAIVHQLTIQYHLRCLGIKWMSWTELPMELDATQRRMLLSDTPAWLHVLTMLASATLLLGLACLVLRQRQLVRAEER